MQVSRQAALQLLPSRGFYGGLVLPRSPRDSPYAGGGGAHMESEGFWDLPALLLRIVAASGVCRSGAGSEARAAAVILCNAQISEGQRLQKSKPTDEDQIAPKKTHTSTRPRPTGCLKPQNVGRRYWIPRQQLQQDIPSVWHSVPKPQAGQGRGEAFA